MLIDKTLRPNNTSVLTASSYPVCGDVGPDEFVLDGDGVDDVVELGFGQRRQARSGDGRRIARGRAGRRTST